MSSAYPRENLCLNPKVDQRSLLDTYFLVGVKNPPTMQDKAMAPHSSTLAWKIPWMEEPGGLQSMGSLSQT